MPQRLVRAIAVGNRVNVAAWRDAVHAIAEIERIVGLAVPHLSHSQPNLIVLGELLGLPGALMGRRGSLARRMTTARQALLALAAADVGNVLAMRRRFNDISPVRALLLSRADALYRPLSVALPRLARQHNATIIAGTAAPLVERSTRPQDIRRWGQPGADEVFLASASEVYNAALVATPDGAVQRVNKVFLTASEMATLDICPGALADIHSISTPAGRIGVAISLDAFTPTYLHYLDTLEAEIVVQPDANDQLWVAPSQTCDWQPQEWLNSVLGSVQAEYPHLQANVCAMQTGNFFDVTFDGQSTIIHNGDKSPAIVDNFVGNEGFIHTVTHLPMTGEILALAPWVIADPITRTPTMPLAERRAQLQAVGKQLLPHGQRAGQFREVAIWADVLLR